MSGHIPTVRVRLPWMRSVRGEEDSRPEVTVLDVVVVSPRRCWVCGRGRVLVPLLRGIATALRLMRPVLVAVLAASSRSAPAAAGTTTRARTPAQAFGAGRERRLPRGAGVARAPSAATRPPRSTRQQPTGARRCPPKSARKPPATSRPVQGAARSRAETDLRDISLPLQDRGVDGLRREYNISERRPRGDRARGRAAHVLARRRRRRLLRLSGRACASPRNSASAPESGGSVRPGVYFQAGIHQASRRRMRRDAAESHADGSVPHRIWLLQLILVLALVLPGH